MLRLNYDRHNGHPYYAGRPHPDRAQGIVPNEEMSMDRIREWMEDNPDEGKELRARTAPSCSSATPASPNDDEPIGAQGVPLTPGRSIAVDKTLHVYGTPFFIEAELPIESEKPRRPNSAA